MSTQALGFVNIRLPDGTSDTVRYDKFVERLFKVDTHKEMVHHAKGGCCEEAGELSTVLKDVTTYGKPLMSIDKKSKTPGQTLYGSIVEELGDLRFYMQAVMNLYAISEQDMLQHNAQKLQERYAGLVYSDDAAIARADKSSGE